VPYETGLEAVERLRPLVPAGATLAQLALRWILMFDAVSCAIPGAKTPVQARENAAAATLAPFASRTWPRCARSMTRRSGDWSTRAGESPAPPLANSQDDLAQHVAGGEALVGLPRLGERDAAAIGTWSLAPSTARFRRRNSIAAARMVRGSTVALSGGSRVGAVRRPARGGTLS